MQTLEDKFKDWVFEKTETVVVLKALCKELLFHWHMEGKNHVYKDKLAKTNLENFAEKENISVEQLTNELANIWYYLMDTWEAADKYEAKKSRLTRENIIAKYFILERLDDISKNQDKSIYLEQLILMCRGVRCIPGLYFIDFNFTTEHIGAMYEMLREMYNYIDKTWEGQGKR